MEDSIVSLARIVVVSETCQRLWITCYLRSMRLRLWTEVPLRVDHSCIVDSCCFPGCVANPHFVEVSFFTVFVLRTLFLYGRSASSSKVIPERRIGPIDGPWSDVTEEKFRLHIPVQVPAKYICAVPLPLPWVPVLLCTEYFIQYSWRQDEDIDHHGAERSRHFSHSYRYGCLMHSTSCSLSTSIKDKAITNFSAYKCFGSLRFAL